MRFSQKTDPNEADDLKGQVALLKDQLMAAQAMLEDEAKARIALEKLMESRSDP